MDCPFTFCQSRSIGNNFWQSANILDKPSVRKFIDERYGGSAKFPMEEQVVAPNDLAASTMLEEPPRK